MRDAVQIKVQLVRWLNPLLAHDELLASEVRFQDGASRADLAVVGPMRLCAIEIKGPRDDFRRLAKQLDAYTRLFLEVHVAVERADVAQLRAFVPSTVGILSIEAETIRVVRKARKRAYLQPTDAASWLLVSELRSLLPESRGSETRSQLIERACVELSPKALTSAALSAVHARLLPRYSAYRSELGVSVTSDDIRILSIPTSIEP